MGQDQVAFEHRRPQPNVDGPRLVLEGEEGIMKKVAFGLFLVCLCIGALTPQQLWGNPWNGKVVA